MKHYRIGEGKWVFLDWMGVEPGYGISLNENAEQGFCVPRDVRIMAHRVEADPVPVILPEKPWETGHVGVYASFMKDNGVYRCWYEPVTRDGSMKLAYAESDNGITWGKPDLKLREFNGSMANNLLAYYTHGHSVFRDPVADDASRYKMAGCYWKDDVRYISGAVSRDGIEWTALPEPILDPQHADTKNEVLYDEDIRRYVIYTRQTTGKMQRRGVNRSVSHQFEKFPPSVPVIESNPIDPPDWDIYCSGYSKWPGAADAHVMRLSVYRHTTDGMEIHLATSRDGEIWHRPMGLEGWLEPISHSDRRLDTVYACSGIVPTGKGEWSTYVATLRQSHNIAKKERDPDGTIWRVPMREDGFMSLTGGAHGEFWTIPFKLQADSISVNLQARPGGYLRCAIHESGIGDTGVKATVGPAFKGFDISDSSPVEGDKTDALLTWNSGASTASLSGKDVRLHIELVDADLYSLKFQSKG